MRIKQGFTIRQVADKIVALPSGENLDLNMMILLNDTAAFIWKKLENESTEESLVEALLEEYNVDEATARKSVKAFIATLRTKGFLSE